MTEILPGFESAAWYAVVAPPKTPKAIVEKLNDDINEALRQPDVQDHLRKLSADIVGGPVAETAKFMHKEVDRWNEVIKTANVKMQ